MKGKNKARETAILGVMCAASLILSYIEGILPLNFGIPGAKIGLSNLMVLTALYVFDVKRAFFLMLGKVFLTALLFGNGVSLAYSLAGGVLSLSAMAVFMKSGKFGYLSVSVMGGIFHNLGQLMVAALVMENFKLAVLLPYLTAAGAGAGFIIGAVSGRIIPAAEKLKGDF